MTGETVRGYVRRVYPEFEPDATWRIEESVWVAIVDGVVALEEEKSRDNCGFGLIGVGWDERLV